MNNIPLFTNIKDINILIEKSILRFVENKGYEFVNSKISSGIKGISKIYLPHADAIGTLTATGTRDYVATISLECDEPKIYKHNFWLLNYFQYFIIMKLVMWYLILY